MKLVLWVIMWFLVALILGMIFGCAHVTVIPPDPNWRENYNVCMTALADEGPCIYDEDTQTCLPVWKVCQRTEARRKISTVWPIVKEWNDIAGMEGE